LTTTAVTFNNSLLLTLPNPKDLDIEISPMLNEDLLDEKQDFTKEDLIESHDIGGDATDTESDEEEENENGQKRLQIILPDTSLTKNTKDQQR
jgi:hypothetical protein